MVPDFGNGGGIGILCKNEGVFECRDSSGRGGGIGGDE